MTGLLFSVVIPTCNRPQYLRRCLASLRREAGYDQPLEVIVADDGSRPEVAGANRQHCEEFQARYITDGKNHGMAVARNRGIAQAKGEWIIFLDDDVTCDAGWFRELGISVASFPSGVAAFEGKINPSGSGIWDREVQNLTGGACLTSHFGVRRSTIDACGMFDPFFEITGPYCEDHEFALRIMAHGTVVFTEQCSVTHAPREVNLVRYLLRAPVRTRGLLLSDRYLFEKHPMGYRRFRHHASFAQTSRAYRLRHVFHVLGRRKLKDLFVHPLQTMVLLLAALVEQGTAWIVRREVAAYPFDISTVASGRDKRLDDDRNIDT